MNAKVFLDTNVWIYLYSEDTKSLTAQQLIHRYFENIVVSTQVLGECFSVLTRKKFKQGEESKEIIRHIASSYTVADTGKSSVLIPIRFQKTVFSVKPLFKRFQQVKRFEKSLYGLKDRSLKANWY
jgi:predicted nucleic acid-binding protein